MTHVSRFPIHKDVYIEILRSLYRLVADLRRPEEVAIILEDFLTKTERLMLAKRLALAKLIMEGYDEVTIHRLLHVSKGTIYHMKQALQKSSSPFQQHIRKCLQQEAFQKLIESSFAKSYRDGVHPLTDRI